MSGSSLMYRRLGQRHQRYPFPDFPLWAMRAVLAAIIRSFNDAISAAENFSGENDLSAVLVDELNELRRAATVPAFSAQLFQVVTRDGCSSTFDGTSLQKRPDMIFRLATSLDEYEGWFVECKIVDATHPPGLYFSMGVSRFVSGEYAWAMPSALMVAYAGTGYSTRNVTKLAPRCQPSTLLKSPQLQHSDHPRSWAYPGTSRGPGDLRILHLWLYGAQFE